jgi:DNA-binding NarL/FixJ family response regulator
VNCQNPASPSDQTVLRPRTLSETDAAILQLLAAGSSSVKIATHLHMSRQAVDYHIHAMLRSLKAVNRPGLVSKAYTLGIMVVDSWPPRVWPDCVG